MADAIEVRRSCFEITTVDGNRFLGDDLRITNHSERKTTDLLVFTSFGRLMMLPIEEVRTVELRRGYHGNGTPVCLHCNHVLKVKPKG